MRGEGSALICPEQQRRCFATVSLAKEKHSTEWLGDGDAAKGLATEARWFAQGGDGVASR